MKERKSRKKHFLGSISKIFYGQGCQKWGKSREMGSRSRHDGGINSNIKLQTSIINEENKMTLFGGRESRLKFGSYL